MAKTRDYWRPYSPLTIKAIKPLDDGPPYPYRFPQIRQWRLAPRLRNPYRLEPNLVLKRRERAQYATVSRELRSNAFARNPRHEGVYSAADAPGNVSTNKSKR
jgi:hypothetical protein